MANTNRANFLMGVDLDVRQTSPEFEVGTICHGNAGNKFVYVQANGAIAASQTDISVTSAGQASDGSGTYVGSAIAFADNEYGWVLGTDI